MGYTIFERKVRRVHDPAVSVQKLGRIVLNKVAAEAFNETGATTALILWDEDRRTFAIRPIFKKDSRSYPVRFAKGTTTAGATINAKTFLDHIGCDLKETRQFPAEWNDQEGLLEVTLPEDIFKPQKRAGGVFPLSSARRGA